MNDVIMLNSSQAKASTNEFNKALRIICLSDEPMPTFAQITKWSETNGCTMDPHKFNSINNTTKTATIFFNSEEEANLMGACEALPNCKTFLFSSPKLHSAKLSAPWLRKNHSPPNLFGPHK